MSMKPFSGNIEVRRGRIVRVRRNAIRGFRVLAIAGALLTTIPLFFSPAIWQIGLALFSWSVLFLVFVSP